MLETGIIDVHHHIIPRKYVEALAKKGIGAALGMPFPQWDIETTLELMDVNGIATAIVSISAPGVYFNTLPDAAVVACDLARQVNEIAAQLVADHPNRFGAFATLPLPDTEAALKEIEYALDTLKLDGIVLLTNYDGCYLGDSKFDEVLFELNRRNAVVFIHPDTPPEFDKIKIGLPAYAFDVCFDTTRAAYSLILSGMMEKYSSIRFILAHAGGTVPYLASRVRLINLALPEIAKKMPNGLEYYLKKFYYDTALSAYPATFSCLKEVLETTQIVFGSDYVFAPAPGIPITIQGIREYKGFDKEMVGAIERGNAMRLFPRLKRE
ncbi:Predicted metal-dependent hydrolase, TIM-barrel fold [Propionispira arboris]|uniref:Predicted metal-dependent hydrolase, TIM-barrel fold n=1 Tax=Propionispira arboris TaxID=84035 RepID=A0A1H6XLD5_9FIRM|nr:amidohydrolase family protein [Propionispira arboris]SEJ28966.1 Predicted metal-dependent hydrolase, TIM-barrel fold [Propionispira arboris]